MFVTLLLKCARHTHETISQQNTGVWPISILATLYCAFRGINSVSPPFKAQLTKVINLPIVADAKQSISWLSAGEKQINKQTNKQINNCPPVRFGLGNVCQSHADFGCVSPTQ